MPAGMDGEMSAVGGDLTKIWYPKTGRHIGPALNKGGHAVLAIGFKDGDETKRDGFILCQVSWGTDDEVGGAPLFWIPYNNITDFTATQDF